MVEKEPLGKTPEEISSALRHTTLHHCVPRTDPPSHSIFGVDHSAGGRKDKTEVVLFENFRAYPQYVVTYTWLERAKPNSRTLSPPLLTIDQIPPAEPWA